MNATDYDELLVRIDERTANIVKDVTEIKEETQKHNGDIQALKIWQARLTGAFGVVAVICLVAQDELREAVIRLLAG